MNHVYHARSSARRFGGRWQDFAALHHFMDHSKAAFAGVEHRLFLHTRDLGLALAIRAFGITIHTDSRSLPVEPIVLQHLMEDFGSTPSLDDWLRHLRVPAFLREQERPLVPADVEPFIGRPLEAAAHRWGGQPEDYAPLNDLLRLPLGISSHPACLLTTHNTLGPFLAERVLGEVITTSTGRLVPTRLVAEKFIHSAIGYIPSADDILCHLSPKPWMSGSNAPEPVET